MFKQSQVCNVKIDCQFGHQWPFEDQECKMSITSWMNDTRIKYIVDPEFVEFDTQPPNYNVMPTTAYRFVPEKSSIETLESQSKYGTGYYMLAKFTIENNPDFAVGNIIFPTILSMVMVMFIIFVNEALGELPGTDLPGFMIGCAFCILVVFNILGDIYPNGYMSFEIANFGGRCLMGTTLLIILWIATANWHWKLTKFVCTSIFAFGCQVFLHAELMTLLGLENQFATELICLMQIFMIIIDVLITSILGVKVYYMCIDEEDPVDDMNL